MNVRERGRFTEAVQRGELLGEALGTVVGEE
jgi:hypothetical protein